MRDRVGVDQNSGQNENRAERKQFVHSKIGKDDIRQRFQNAGDHERPEDRTNLLPMLRAFVLAIFSVEDECSVEEKEVDVCDEDVCKRSKICLLYTSPSPR